MLWFDVERGYKTTGQNLTLDTDMLWFDVERGYKTTQLKTFATMTSCGLM